MGRLYMLAVVLAIAQLGCVSHASADDGSPSFTVMNYLKVEDFTVLYCHCVDVKGTVSTMAATVGNCIDKEFQASTCPTGAAVDTLFCNFKYYARNRQVSPSTITPQYTNLQVWTRTGPTKTYYQLATDGVYGSTEDKYFGQDTTNRISTWYALYEGNNISILKDKSVGNGRSFR